MGLLTQIGTQERLQPRSPFCQLWPSLKQIIAKSYRLQGQKCESWRANETPIADDSAQV